jgi:hypothetical protein
MFSQFRNAVEHLAQQQQSPPPPRRPASNSVSSQSSAHHAQAGNDTQRSPTNSLDEGRMAETALLNFRKTLISSRSSSPGPSQISDKESSRQIRSLEDRLRASFALGEASERTTPDTSKLPSPGEVDPVSVALPLSPEQELPVPSLEEAFDPLGAQLSPDPSRNALSPPPLAAAEPERAFAEPLPHPPSEAVHEPTSDTDPPGAASPISSPPPESPKVVPPLADMPDHLTGEASMLAAPMPKSHLPDLAAPQPDSRPSTPRPLSPFPIEDREPDLEKLRERLKLVERRFTGEPPS